VVTKPDKEGAPVGTGVAYVRFTSPNEAERARKERHRQQMGSRYIECLPFTASHYTSPAALPPQMVPSPALSGLLPMGMNMRYPGPHAAQRPFPSMAALERALPAQEVLHYLPSYYILQNIIGGLQASCRSSDLRKGHWACSHGHAHLRVRPILLCVVSSTLLSALSKDGLELG